MKKLILVLAALLLVSAGAFAVDAEVSASIEGNASVTFGVDLDSSATGFANASSSNLKITIVPKASEEKGSDEAVYGWIKLKDFETVANKDDGFKLSAPGVEAKLVLGPAYINILGIGNDIDAAYIGKGLTASKDDAAVRLLDIPSNGVSAKPTEEFAGLGIGADLGVVKFEVSVASLYDWKSAADTETVTYKWVKTADLALADNEVAVGVVGDTTLVEVTTTEGGNMANVDNKYHIFGSFNVTAVDGLTLGVKGNYDASSENIGLGVEAGYALPLGDFSAEVLVGFDMLLTDPAAWEIGAGLLFGFGGDGLSDVEYFGLAKANYKAGLGVGLLIGSGDVKSLTVSLYDGALIPVLDLVVQLDMDLAEAFGLGVRASADLGVASPFGEFWTVAEGSTKLKLGVDIKVITNTTFSLAYTSGDLAADPAGKGTVEFTTKVSF
jgi:hypothetical protein